MVGALTEFERIDEVVVVDNGSQDATGEAARAAGARVVAEDRPGMGHAIRAGFMAARNDWVMKVDADLDRFDIPFFARMIEARAPGVGLVKGQWQDPRDPMPMTRYLVTPALRVMFPALGDLKAPNSGIYAFDRSLIALPEIVGDYAADLDVMIRVHAAGAEVVEVDIGRLDNNLRDPGHYSAMAETIMGFLLRQQDLRINREMVALADDAQQVITGCLGTIVSHARAGGRVSVFLDKTEAVSFGLLQDALRGFPTAEVGPLAGAVTFLPATSARGLQVIAPRAALRGENALQPALDLLRRQDLEDDPVLLLMPDGADDAEFQADTGRGYRRGGRCKTGSFGEAGAFIERKAPA